MKLEFSAFWIGVGISLCCNAILGGIGYYTMEFGQTSFLWISTALYGPSFPIALAMALLSDLEQQKCTVQEGLWCDARRVIVSFVTMGVLCFSIASSTDISTLLTLAAVVGALQAIAMGYAFQMVLRAGASAKGGRYEAALSFGFQASSVVCFLTQLASDFSPMATKDNVWIYYSVIGAITFACAPCVVFFARFALVSNVRNEEIPILSNEEGQQELQLQQNCNNSNVETDGVVRNTTLYSWKEAANDSFGCALGLSIAIFASIVVFPFYSFAPSDQSGMEASARLASSLFYTKTFADTLSRPATIALPKFVQSQRTLLIVASLRLLLFVPAFFIYVFGKGAIPPNDYMFLIVVGFFAASSGYLKTVAFQLAPTEGKPVTSIRRITTILNLSFQLGLFVALLISILIRFTLVENMMD